MYEIGERIIVPVREIVTPAVIQGLSIVAILLLVVFALVELYRGPRNVR